MPTMKFLYIYVLFLLSFGKPSLSFESFSAPRALGLDGFRVGQIGKVDLNGDGLDDLIVSSSSGAKVC